MEHGITCYYHKGLNSFLVVRFDWLKDTCILNSRLQLSSISIFFNEYFKIMITLKTMMKKRRKTFPCKCFTTSPRE